MIDYGTFQFACMPNSGGSWFYRTLKAVNTHPCKVTLGGVYSLFPEERNGELLRVSMVRNPCDWLLACYSGLIKTENRKPNEHLFELSKLPSRNPIEFVSSYIQNIPGSISKWFLDYQADSYIRIEDVPWVMYEFLEMIGKPRPDTLPKSTVFQLNPVIPGDLRLELIKVEKEMCDAFDYY